MKHTSWFLLGMVVLSSGLVGCCADHPPMARLSYQAVFEVDEGGVRYGFAGDVDAGAPLAMLEAGALDDWACETRDQIDKRFGATCANFEPEAAGGTQHDSGTGVSGPSLGLHRTLVEPHWYCSDNWIIRVVAARCLGEANDGGGEAKFRVTQVVLRNKPR